MFFLNLSLPEFLAIFSAVSGLVVALYLLDRSRRKQTVSTLRFWTGSALTQSTQRRRKIQQPWSLILQLLSLALLLLAIAQLRWGAPEERVRDHVVLLDTSAWMAARTANGTLLDEARRSVRAYLRALPSSDRVMLVRVDALATPATQFEADRGRTEQALADSRPGFTALNLQQAVQFAEQTQRMHGRTQGEIVYAGAARGEAEQIPASVKLPANFRLLQVRSVVENCGLRKVGIRRSTTDSEVWDVYASVRNYGRLPKSVTVTMQFGGQPLGLKRLVLPPGSDHDVTFALRTRSAGPLEVRILEPDAIPEDNRAVLEAPAQMPLRVAVFSDAPEKLRAIFSSNSLVRADYFPAAAYSGATGAQVVVLDGFAPRSALPQNAIVIMPPAGQSPIPVRTTAEAAPLARWHSENALGEGIRTKQVKFEKAQVFAPGPNDLSIVDIDGGPVAVARPGKPKVVVLGFQPTAAALRYELATPLLFANLLRWMEPDTFRRWELAANTAGSVAVALEKETDPNKVEVSTDDGRPLPYTVQSRMVRFFESRPGIVRVKTGDRELVYALSLPEIADADYKLPADIRQGTPGSFGPGAVSHDLWQILAALGMLGLMLEWFLFGRKAGATRLARGSAGLRKLWGRIGPRSGRGERPLRRAS